MKIALVHDYLIQDGGAERVLRAFADLWPNAPIHVLLHDPARMGPAFRERDVRTSFLQRFPDFARGRFKWLLPFMPAATESYDLRGYDVVLSSTSAFAKGVIVPPGTTHICYCHTPTRFLWTDAHEYVNENVPWPVRPFMPLVLSHLRQWDRMAADRVDRFVANSETVAARIRRYYGRDSDVINPPVNVARFAVADRPGEFWLAGGRLVYYKRFDLAVRAFSKLGLPLKVFGDGPEFERLRREAKPNVEFLGRVSDATKAELYRRAIAYIHPQEEDFGITMVEAMAAGRPVLALARGGATEVVQEGVTGEFFREQSWEELANHVILFDAAKFDPQAIRAYAEKYDVTLFKEKIRTAVERTRTETLTGANRTNEYANRARLQATS